MFRELPANDRADQQFSREKKSEPMLGSDFEKGTV